MPTAFAAQARTLADEAVGRLPDVAASDVSEAREIGVGQKGPLDQDSTSANSEDSGGPTIIEEAPKG